MKQILAIDDKKDNLLYIKEVLKGYLPGYEIIFAHSGREGIELAKKIIPDTIILDILMPDLNGYEVCKILKGDKATKYIPVIMISAILSQGDTKSKCLEVGADGFFSQPISPEELTAQVKLMLRVKDAEFKLREENRKLQKEVLQNKEDIQISKKRFNALIENSNTSIWSVDREYRLIFGNSEFFKDLKQVFKLNFKIGDCLLVNLLPDKEKNDWKSYYDRALEGEKFSFVRERRFSTSQKWNEYHMGPVLNDEGEVIAVTTIAADITKQKKAELELIQAKDRAEESDLLKSSFLANISHEIRTPLNGIIGMPKLLRRDDISTENKHKYLDMIEQNGFRMLNLINDLLDISKLEANQTLVKNEDFNLNEQIEFLFSFFNEEAARKGIVITYDVSLADTSAQMNGDRDKIIAVLVNLLKNALKFTAEGSIKFGYTIEKEGKKENSDKLFVQFYVKDTGIGIKKEFQEKIFHRFVHESGSASVKYDGIGLGLFISKSYVELMNGEIWTVSDHGKGAEFYFKIPLQKSTKIMGKNNNPGLPENKPARGELLNIMIVDDDDVSATYLYELLKDKCNKIIEVSSGQEAIEMIKENDEINLIMMDIKLPGMSGYEATRRIRKINKDIIIIAQTSYALLGDRNKAIEAGCNEYISKPIDQEILINIINRLAGKENV